MKETIGKNMSNFRREEGERREYKQSNIFALD